MPTAVYIDYPRITAVEMTGSARKPRVKRVVVGELPEARNEDGTPIADRQGHLNTYIEKFVKEHKLGSGKVFLLVGPEGMRFRDLHLSFSDRRQIDRVLQFQVEGVIPNGPIEEMALGYNILRADPEGAQLLVHAADKEYVRSRILALEEAGLVVEGADSHLSGTINLGLLHPELASGTPHTLWLDFAGTIATVAEVHEGKVISARVFLSPYLAGASGGTALADTAKDEARLAQHEAEARARDFHGATDSVTLPPSDSVNIGEQEVAARIRHMSQDELQKFLSRVAIEAKRTMLMSNLAAEPQRLVVSGLGAAGEDLAAHLGEELALADTLAIDLMDAVNPAGKGGAAKLPDVGELSYLAGVALKGVGRDYTKINFRYGDLAAGTLFDYAKTPLAFTATLALLFAGILFLMSFTHARQYEKQIFDLRDGDNGRGVEYYFKDSFNWAEKLKKSNPELEIKVPSYNRVEDDPAAEIRNTHKKLREHQKFLQGETKDNYLRPHPADEILAEVFKAIAAAHPSYDFTLLKVQIAPTSVRIEYLASLTETDKERQKLPADLRDLQESERLYAAFGAMVVKNPVWFSGSPGVVPGTGIKGPEGREVRPYTLTFTLNKVQPPKPAATEKGGKK